MVEPWLPQDSDRFLSLMADCMEQLALLQTAILRGNLSTLTDAATDLKRHAEEIQMLAIETESSYRSPSVDED